MPKRLIRLFTSIVFLLAALDVSRAAEQRTAVKLADLPAKVQNAIHQHVGKGKLQDIEKVVQDEEVTFEVDMRKNNRARSFTLGEDGELLEMEVFFRETPEPVREAIKKRVGTAEIEGISKVFDDGKTTFEVEFGSGRESGTEKTRTFSLDDKGALVERQVLVSETPVPVQAAIRKQAAAGKVAEITEVFEDGAPEYELEMQSGTQGSLVTLDEKGDIVETEQPVSDSELPEPVQKTITDLSKDASAHKVIKTVEGDEVSFNARFHRSDHWEMVAVGSDGKIVE